MYNDEFNNNDMYRFTNRDVPRDDYVPVQRQEQPHAAPAAKQGFFRRTWVKVTALVLACAVVGGAAGYGGAQSAQNRQHDKPGQSFLHFRDVFLPILFSRRHTISFSTCRMAALLSADMVF